jgi:hypothetical protein
MAGNGNIVARELRHMLPPTLFFLVAFNLIGLSLAVLQPGPVGSLTFATATVAALICGKAVLIADKLPFFNRYPDRPLIWNVVWKALLYVAITGLFRLIDTMVHGWLDDRHVGAGVEHALAGFAWPRFLIIQLWLAALFLVYTLFSELVLTFGRERMMRLFFGPVESPGA